MAILRCAGNVRIFTSLSDSSRFYLLEREGEYMGYLVLSTNLVLLPKTVTPIIPSLALWMISWNEMFFLRISRYVVGCRFVSRVTGLVALEVVHRSFVAHVELTGRICNWLPVHSCCTFVRRPWRITGAVRRVRRLAAIVKWRNYISFYTTHLQKYI